jgi:hypothetical protein
MDFVFDRTAEGRVINCRVIANDATHVSIATVPDCPRILAQLRATRGGARAIRTDSGKEPGARAILPRTNWRGVMLRPIGPGRPIRNASVCRSTA